MSKRIFDLCKMQNKSICRMEFINSKTKFILLVFVLLLVFSTDNCFGFNDEGFQVWTSAGASFKLSKDWKVSVAEEFRLGNDGGNMYYHHTDVGFIYSGFAKWLDLSFNYRQIHQKDSKDEWRPEKRPHFNIKFKTRFAGLDLSDNSRFEYRVRKHKEDVWRYRNKFMVKLPKFKDIPLQPYIADEVFVDMNQGNFEANRIYFGAYYNVTDSIKANIFYLHQSQKTTAKWKKYNVLGTSMVISF